MSTSLFQKKNPILSIIQIGLENWVRKQCKSIKKIKIDIKTSLTGLFSGKLSEVNVEAEQINFKNLILHNARLKSGPIEIELDLTNKYQKLALRKDFHIQGTIRVTNENLNQIIHSQEWNWISTWLEEKLLDSQKLEKIFIKDGLLEFLTSNKNKDSDHLSTKFELHASSGTIVFKNKKKQSVATLPMDPAINITNAIAKYNEIVLIANAKVNI